MLVICYCITINSKTWYKMTHFCDLTVSVGQEWMQFSCVLWLRMSHKAAVTSELFKEGSISLLTQCLLEDPVPYRLFPQGLNYARVTGYRQTYSSSPSTPLLRASHNMVPCFIRASKEWETESRIVRWKSQSFETYSQKWHRINHFCHILFFPSSLGLRKC